MRIEMFKEAQPRIQKKKRKQKQKAQKRLDQIACLQ